MLAAPRPGRGSSALVGIIVVASLTGVAPAGQAGQDRGGNTIGAATPMAMPGTEWETISSWNDSDYWRFTTVPKSQHRIIVTLDNLPADYDLELYQERRDVHEDTYYFSVWRASDTEGLATEKIVVHTKGWERGNFAIRVFSGNGVFDVTRPYRVTVERRWPGHDKGASRRVNAVPVGVPAAIRNYARDDEDFWLFYLPRAATVHVVFQWPADPYYGRRRDWDVVLRNFRGRQVARIDDSGVATVRLDPGAYFAHVIGENWYYPYQLTIGRQPPPPPSNVAAAVPALGTAVVRWSPVTSMPVTGYRIQARHNDGPWATVTDVGPGDGDGVVTRAVRGLAAGQYQFRVAAVADTVVSAFSTSSQRAHMRDRRMPSRFYWFVRKGLGTKRGYYSFNQHLPMRVFADGSMYPLWHHNVDWTDYTGVLRDEKVTIEWRRYNVHRGWRNARRTLAATGSWKSVRLDGYTRQRGPAKTIQALPRFIRQDYKILRRHHDVSAW